MFQPPLSCATVSVCTPAGSVTLAVTVVQVCQPPVAGTLTFPRAQPIQAAARAVDRDGHVVETDAPFLAPVPHRGRTNLPGYVAATAAALAALRGESEGAVRERCAANARRLFDLPAKGGDRIGVG